MGERNQITRVNDGCCGDPQQNGTEENNLTLTGICTEGDPSCTTRTRGSEDDPYLYYGPTENDPRAGTDTNGGGNQRYEGGRQVTLRSGDTFWKLAEQMYGGKHPIEAIYAANGLYPKVTEKGNGQIEMTDPTYFAGKTYTMPDERDVDRLTKQYRQKVEELGRSSDQRVGAPDQETKVKLIYGDTFSRLAQAKYDKAVPMEAIYEANGLKATYTQGANGELCAKDPIYYAGKTYTLPAEKDIPELVRRYWDRVGHPEKCPPEYRNGGGAPENDRYGDYGETDRGRQPQPVPPQDGGRYGDYGETNRGRDGGCACGGAGCRNCAPEVPPDGCACGGGGCRNCCPDGENRDDNIVYNEGYEDGYTDGLRRGRADSECACGGSGCRNCGGGQRRWQEGCECGDGSCSNCQYKRSGRGNMCGCGGAGCEACLGNMRRQEPYIDEMLYYRDRFDPDRVRWEEEQRYRQQQNWQQCGCGGAGCQACIGQRPRRRVRQ